MYITVFACECDECGHVWLAKSWIPPDQCAKCKSRNWNSIGKRRRLDRILAEHKTLVEALPEGTDFASFDSHKELARICHAAVNAAIKIKLITKPTECSMCHKDINDRTVRLIVAHHNDYSKPLEIEWLCAICHSQYHWNQGHRKYVPRKQPQELTYEPD